MYILIMEYATTMKMNKQLWMNTSAEQKQSDTKECLFYCFIYVKVQNKEKPIYHDMRE